MTRAPGRTSGPPPPESRSGKLMREGRQRRPECALQRWLTGGLATVAGNLLETHTHGPTQTPGGV